MALIPEDKIAEIRDRTDIVQVIGEFVPLRRSGVNWKGLCPFHAERSPSFNVNQAKQMYHCFGCGKSGDVIRFLMEHDGKPFIEVVRELAKRAGIDLPEPEVSPAALEARKRAESDRARMLKLNRLVSDFFREQYAVPSGARARAYVEEKRGISAQTRDAFLLGYAPPGWDALTRFLESRRVPHELAESAGLIRAREHARLAPGDPPTRASHFDLFRDRVMFPLLSAQGEVIAFGGRALEDTAPDGQRIPKYINSPETILYKKGENLYGIHAARQAIRRAERAILVEGNFDVLAMHDAGFQETVAPMGTALTASQVRLLARSAPKRVYMLLDGDTAGSSAAARNVGIFLDEDQLSFVALLPTGEDPDTFVRRLGREALELLLKRAVESVEYFCQYGWNRTGGSVIERAKLLEEEAAPIIRKVKLPAARQRYAEQLALTLALPLDSVQRMLRGAHAESVQRAPYVPPAQPVAAAQQTAAAGGVPMAVPAAPPPVPPDAIDLELVALLADQPRLALRIGQILRAVESASLKTALATAVRAVEGQSVRIEMSVAAEALEPAMRPEFLKHAMSGRFVDLQDPERALDAILRRRQGRRDAVEIEQLKKRLADARASDDQTRVQEITARINELNQARLGLKG